MREIINLNGWWEWKLPGGVSDKKIVPSCYTCVGDAIYTKETDLSGISGKRIILHFEGVSYTGNVTVNNKPVGDMLPYVFYEFDITGIAHEGKNTVSVLVKDITAKFGPTGGWEDYGGISRDVWIEVREQAGIADTQWITSMKKNYTAADATLNVWLYNETGRDAEAKISAKLIFQGETVAEACESVNLTEDGGKCSLGFQIDRVNAWMTEFPNLYRLEITSECESLFDKVSLDVGFREFIVKGASFYLNGVKTFLKGVARHDMWGEQGFTLSRDQIEQDLTMIKEMGANFIRLVHYPHSRYTIECAAKLGLMVSEEPGLWWSDLSDEDIAGSALEIMRRTVLRDRSNPAVVAWLFFNECRLEGAEAYLKRGADLCRSLDPTRLISGANCMENSVAKAAFDQAGMDFYTQHPYCYDGDLILKAAEELRGKPLVLTEWGGWLIHFNQNLIRNTKKIIARLAHNAEDKPHINGMCWWQWQDIFQYSRGLPGCENGLLSDGLVDRYRKRKETYAVMAEFFDLVEHAPKPFFEMTEYPGAGAAIRGTLTPLDLSPFYGEQNDALWKEARENIKFFVIHSSYSIRGADSRGIYIHNEMKSLSGLRCDIPSGHPVILRGGRPRIDVAVKKNIGLVCLFGAVTYFDGYPMRGVFGETVAKLTLTYADGTAETVQLRHGLEMASASLIACTSRVDARAALAPRIAKITQDCDWEVYAVNLLTIAADKKKTMQAITIEAVDTDYEPVVYGISVGE